MDPVRFDGHERELGAPSDWDAERQGPCVGLPVKRTAEGAWVSVWRPTQEEYARLCAGGDVCLFVYAQGHPAVAVGVSDGTGPIPGVAVPERPVLGDRLKEGYDAGVTVALNVLYRAGLVDLKQCEHVLLGLGVFGETEVLVAPAGPTEEPRSATAEEDANPILQDLTPAQVAQDQHVEAQVPQACGTCKYEYQDMGGRCVGCMADASYPGWEARSSEDRDCYTCRHEGVHEEETPCNACPAETRLQWEAKDAG